MSCKETLDKLQKRDIYSLLLFVMYKLHDEKEYSTISQMSYILDYDSLLKMCQVFGGMTIKIPTINELQSVLDAMMLYQRVDIDKQDINVVGDGLSSDTIQTYFTVKKILDKYTMNPRVDIDV